MQSGGSAGSESLTPEQQRAALIKERAELEIDISKEFNAIAAAHRSHVNARNALGTKPLSIQDAIDTAVNTINKNVNTFAGEKLFIPGKKLKHPDKFNKKISEAETLFELEPKELKHLQDQVKSVINNILDKPQTPANSKALNQLQEYSSAIESVQNTQEQILKVASLERGKNKDETMHKMLEIQKETYKRASTDIQANVQDKIQALETKYKARLDAYDKNITELDSNIANSRRGSTVISITTDTKLTDIEALIKSGERDANGNNVLHHIMQSRPELLGDLIAKYGDDKGNAPILHNLVNQVNSNGLSPLAIAAMKLDKDSVSKLISTGGDINQTIPLEGIGLPKLGINPANLDHPDGSALHTTTCTVNRMHYDRVSLIELMLLTEGQHKDNKDMYKETLRELCTHPTDLNTGSGKLPPLALAAIITAPEAVNVLLAQESKGENGEVVKRVKVNEKSKFDGRTAVHLSVKNVKAPGGDDITYALLNTANARTDITDAYGISVKAAFRTNSEGKKETTNYKITSDYAAEAVRTIGSVSPAKYESDKTPQSLYTITQRLTDNPITVDSLLTTIPKLPEQIHMQATQSRASNANAGSTPTIKQKDTPIKPESESVEVKTALSSASTYKDTSSPQLVEATDAVKDQPIRTPPPLPSSKPPPPPVKTPPPLPSTPPPPLPAKVGAVAQDIKPREITPQQQTIEKAAQQPTMNEVGGKIPPPPSSPPPGTTTKKPPQAVLDALKNAALKLYNIRAVPNSQSSSTQTPATPNQPGQQHGPQR